MKPQIISWCPSKVTYAVNAAQVLAGNGIVIGGNGVWSYGTGMAQDMLNRFGKGGAGPMIGNSYDRMLLNHPADLENGFWVPRYANGIKQMKAEFGFMLDECNRLGVKVNHFVGDGEAGRCFWNLSTENLSYLAKVPEYIEIRKQFPELPEDPGTINMWTDGDKLVALNAALGWHADKARKEAFIDVFNEKMPGGEFSDFGASPTTKEESLYAFDMNGWQQWTTETPCTALSPVIYGYIGNEIYRQPAYKQPYYMTQWMVNTMYAAVSGNKPGRNIWPWFSDLTLSNALDKTFYREMLRCMLVLSGGRGLYFNWGTKDTFTDDPDVQAVCDEYYKVAGDRQGGKAYFYEFVPTSRAAFAVSWLYPDGTKITRVVMKPKSKEMPVSIMGKAVKCKIENDSGCWR